MTKVESKLLNRADHKCELCESMNTLDVYIVIPNHENYDSDILLCSICKKELEEAQPEGTKDQHWFCLQSSMWSEVPAVKVISWRLMDRFKSERWAQDLLEQVYFDEDIIEWAKAGADVEAVVNHGPKTVDSNGTELQDGDSVTLIRDLDVKGTSFVAKRGTLVKGIRLTGNPEHVEGRVNKIAIVLKTQFLKKA